MDHIREIIEEHPPRGSYYGYRRILPELEERTGKAVNHKRLRRLLSEHQLGLSRQASKHSPSPVQEILGEAAAHGLWKPRPYQRCKASLTSGSGTTTRSGDTPRSGTSRPENISGKLSILSNQNLKSLLRLAEISRSTGPKIRAHTQIVFRWLKDRLQLDHFISRDPRGIIRQIVAALIVWGLLTLYNRGNAEFRPKKLWRELRRAMQQAIFDFGRRCQKHGIDPLD